MKIAILSSLDERIPPEKYGGVERVVSFLTEELIKRGHDVTLFASGDSKTKAKLVSVWPKGFRRDGSVKKPQALVTLMMAKFFNEYAQNFDIISNHLDHDPLAFVKFAKAPLVSTLHSTSRPERDVLYRYASELGAYFITISQNQRKSYPEDINFIATIHHGLPIKSFRFNPKPKNYLAWFGRITSPVSVGQKGQDEAIEVAKRLGEKLIMAGKIDKADQKYFNEKVKPKIDGKQIQFIAELNDQEKVPFLGNAKAFLFPVKWSEPFGLAIIEAMACGTPVIAFDRGAAREIIVDGKTGFICKNISEMTEAVERIKEINREKCRKHIEKNFTVQRMVDDYERIFKKIINC